MTDASNSGWGSLYEGNPALSITYQLPRGDGGLSGPQNLSASLKGAPRPGQERQYDGGSSYQSPRWPQVTFPVEDDLTEKRKRVQHHGIMSTLGP